MIGVYSSNNSNSTNHTNSNTSNNNSNSKQPTRASSARPTNSRITSNINKEIVSNINNNNINKNINVKHYNNNMNIDKPVSPGKVLSSNLSNNNLINKQNYEYKTPYKINSNISNNYNQIQRPSSSRDKIQNTNTNTNNNILLSNNSKKRLIPETNTNNDQRILINPIKIVESSNTNKRVMSGVPSSGNIRINYNDNPNNFLKGPRHNYNDYHSGNNVIKVANNGPKLLNLYRK